ncbi:MAG TPA: flagellar hook-basal body complex protein FliE [Xanthobacteraceae bacterium]|jgi:flagellar hook-basal body complex protein FliE|nr:flagellar hook-basal body complex protein FliE [Xanthobacteraceae bacterium]
MASPITAAGAYAKLARLADPAAALANPMTESSSGPGFGELVKEALGNVVEAGRKSDTQVNSVANGKANMVDLVTAVAESETAIATLVSVRDRVIQSYQQIMQMPI